MFNKKEYRRQYRKDNPDKIKTWDKKYKENNPEKIKMSREKWRENNSEYYKQYNIDNCENTKEYNRLYYIEHRDKAREWQKQYCLENKEKIREWKKQYYQINRKKLNERYKKWLNNKRKTDPKFNLSCRTSRAIWASLKGNKAGRHWEDLVEYTVNDLIRHLKKTMPKGYTWQDYMEAKLHIDHIIPLKVFNYTKPEHIDFKRCWALSNLQLLPARENLIKSSKLTKPFQLTLAI